MSTIRKEEIRDMIKANGSKIMSVQFVKKTDGKPRTMQFQPRIVSHIKGTDACESAQKAVKTRKENNPGLVNVWSVDADGPRCFHLDTVTSITLGGEVFIVEKEESV